jgi:hypothetical protein
MPTTWGDPATESFRKKHIRETRPAGTVALVNAQIHAIASRLIEGLSELHVEMPDAIPSYDPEGTEAQRLGLALHLRIAPSPDVAALVSRWGFDGFMVDGVPDQLVELRFTGTPEEAGPLNDQALAVKLDRLEDAEVSGPSLVKWPGDRDLVIGDSGPDVTFLRLVLNAGRDEPVDEHLLEVVGRFQAKRGAPVTCEIDADLWRRILPRRRPLVSAGDSGFIVRVLQAALVAYEGSEHRVTGTWGVLTSKDVTALQKEFNLREARFVRDPEWAVLLGPVNARVEEARARALGVGVPPREEPAVEEKRIPQGRVVIPMAGLPDFLNAVIRDGYVTGLSIKAENPPEESQEPVSAPPASKTTRKTPAKTQRAREAQNAG